MANKTNRIIIRMNDIDLSIIKQKAELSQMSISEYMRVSATSRKVDGFNKSSVYVQEDTQINGQMSIQDMQTEEPKQEEKQPPKAKRERKKKV